ncbi:TPA: hypothetical protein QDA93_002338 [Burkholderia vietnamiensis]|nr:hypothetical protein [Burkholderia vietnamiensis]
MKKLLILLLALPALAFAQTYPSPTFNSVILQNPLTPANGGTGATSSTGTGSVVLSNSPSLASPTITGSLTATGLVTLPSLATQAANTVVANVTGSSASPTAFPMPSCSTANSALKYTSGTGWGCGTTFALTSGNLSQFAATTSAQLAGVISDETGTGALVFGTNPTLAGLTSTGTVAISSSSPLQAFNSTTTTLGTLNFNATGGMYWQVQPTTSAFPVCRYNAGTFVDCPFSLSNSSGLLTLLDGLAVTGTVSGSGFDNYITSANTIGLIDSMTNAKAYGALGNSNGTHGNGNDDTTALQNALNASANGILHIPCGTYRITASLQESSTNNYWIKGDGQCTKIYNDASTAVPTFRFNPSSYNGNVNPTIKITGINFITPNVSGGGQTAVTYQNESAPHFTGNIVQGYQVGLSFTTTYGPIIDHNSFYSMKGAAIDCSIDASCNNAQIHQNGFFSNGITNSDAAIKMSSPTNINGFSVIGNDIEGNYGGIIASNVSGGVIAGNYIENQTGYNLWFASGNSSIDINGNWLGASPTLTLQGLSNSVFQNNAIYNYTIGQGTTTSVRQINNTTTGTGSITLPSIGQLNSNTTSGTSMTSNTPVNCTSITLPAGTWDISGSVQFAPASTTVVNYMHSSISLTSATMAPQPNRTDIGGISATGSNVGSMSESTPVVRETFASSTPVYLVGNSVFTTSTMTCNGYIRAVLVQ